MLSRIATGGPAGTSSEAPSAPVHSLPSTAADVHRQPARSVPQIGQGHSSARIATAFDASQTAAKKLQGPLQASRLWQRIVANGFTPQDDAREFGAMVASEVVAVHPDAPVTPAHLKCQFDIADQCLDALEKDSGTRLGECRYNTKKLLLEGAISRPNTDHGELLRGYNQFAYFRGKHKILNEAVRSCLEADLRLETGDRSPEEPRRIQRLTQDDMAVCSQQDYVRHVCNLFNLESRVDAEAWRKMLAQSGRSYRRTMAELGIPDLPPPGLRFKDAVAFLAGAFETDANRGADRRMRNQHPASVLLEAGTGLVYHPHYDNPALTDANSDYGFQNIAATLRTKYLAAKQSGDLPRFFHTAFVRQDPCFEAVAENILNYDGVTVIFYPKPPWIKGLSDEDNLGGLLAWVQRGLLREYAQKARIDLEGCNAKEIDRIESSPGFSRFLSTRTAEIVEKMVNESAPFSGESLILQIVEADLALGLELAAGKRKGA